LLRCGKSCRLRWLNYLRPDVKRGQILADEEDIILRLHHLLGNRWSLIAGRIPGRTDNEIKNFWNTHLSKKLISQGFDPRTHKPLSESDLDNHDENSVDSEIKVSPTASDQSRNKFPETASLALAENIDAASKVAEYQHFPQIIRDNQLRETSSSLNIQAFNDTANGASKCVPSPPMIQDSTACNHHSCNPFHTNPTFILPCNSASEVGLQDHDSSLYLRRNSTTNSYFVAPSMTDSVLQSITSFPGTVNENSPYQGFQENFEPSQMQQGHLPEQMLVDTNPIAPDAFTDDNNSDILTYFLESFVDEDHLHNEIKKHAAASSLLENRHQFSVSNVETSNQHGYDMWSIMPPPSQFP
ncbi:hypothetical protein KI387_007139, partial [Taxus chinensis]